MGLSLVSRSGAGMWRPWTRLGPASARPDWGHCTSDTHCIQHPLPASGHQQPPAVTWSTSAQCRNWPDHPQCSLLYKNIIYLPFELIVGRIKIVGILGKSVSLFLEVSSLLSHWAVGMRQKDKIILGLYLHLFLYNLFNLRAQLTFLRWYNLFW